MPPWLYLLTQWAAFPLYFLRALVPFDPAFYRYHPPASWPPDALPIVLAWARSPSPWWRGRCGAGVAGRSGRLRCCASPPACSLPRRWWRSRRWWSIIAPTSAASGSRSPSAALSGGSGRAPAGARRGRGCWPRGASTTNGCSRDPVRAWEDAVRRAPPRRDAICALGESYAARERPPRRGRLPAGGEARPAGTRATGRTSALYYTERRTARGGGEAALRRPPRRPREMPPCATTSGMVLEGLGRDGRGARRVRGRHRRGARRSRRPHINLAALLLRRGEQERARALLETASRYADRPAGGRGDRGTQRQLQLPLAMTRR